MKKTFLILTLFLLISMTTSMSMAADNVKVLDSNGSDITENNHVVSDENETEEGGTNETADISEYETQEDSDGVLKILQTAGENALNGFTEGLINALFEGAVTIFETDVSKEDDGSVTYDVQMKELSPFEHPLLVPIQLVTFGFLILITILTILGSMFVSVFQTRHPETYGELKRSISGVYSPYNPTRVHAACVWSTTRPILYFVGFVSFVWGRNYIVNTMIQTASGTITPETDNIVIWGITGIAMFIGSFQTSVGEYGVYMFGTLLFIICIITDGLMVFGKRDVAKQIENVAWGAFGLFCICDLINMFCTSFGVYTSQWLDDPIYITDGIIAGGFINSVLLVSLTIYAVLKIKKVSGV